MDKPILFNTEMVRAILGGRKTATRRLIKPQPEMHMFGDHEALAWLPPAIIKGYLAVGVEYTEYLKKPYRPGDILWVRETFRIDYLSNIIGMGRVHYKADGSFADIRFAPNRYDMMRRAQLKPGWRPNENMPREAARIFLRVTDARVERLQDISVEDAKKEGIKPRHFDGCSACGAGYPHYPECDYEHCGNYQNFYGDWRWIVPFAELWDSTIRPADREKYGWTANPWVWRVKFERCEKPKEAT